MTLLQIQMLLHYYVVCEPYSKHDQVHANSPSVITQRSLLIDNELLEKAPDDESGYRVTDRGKVYVEAIKALKLPIQVWAMPEP